MRIPVWNLGDSEGKEILDGRFDFVFRKPNSNFYLEKTDPIEINWIPNKKVVIEKVWTGKDNVHVQVLITGNPIWVVVIIVFAIMGCLGLGVWLLVRIDRLVNPTNLIFILLGLVGVILIVGIIKGRSIRGVITG